MQRSSQRSLSFRLARAALIILFAFSVALFCGSLLVDIIPARHEVRSGEGALLGFVSIPADIEEHALIFLSVAIVSGLQIWVLSLIPKTPNQSLEPTAPSGRGSS
jgi:hypothetical protein